MAAAVDAAGRGEVLVRLSTWARPTVSLGAFQRLADARACPAFAGMPIVRRPSGGGAIVHDREITYSLALPTAQVLHVGDDAALDVRAARAAGIFTVVTPNPVTAQLDFAEADLVLPSLDERILVSSYTPPS